MAAPSPTPSARDRAAAPPASSPPASRPTPLPLPARVAGLWWVRQLPSGDLLAVEGWRLTDEERRWEAGRATWLRVQLQTFRMASGGWGAYARIMRAAPDH